MRRSCRSFQQYAVRFFAIASTACLPMLAQSGASYLVRTVAGGYSGVGASGDGGPAIQAQLNLSFPGNSVAVDGMGNVFVVDQGNNRIRKVAPSGVVTTFAGTGVAGSAGDGGSATAAQLNVPISIAVDATGRVYIGECAVTGNPGSPQYNRIRVVDTNGVITTLASVLECAFALTTDSSSNVYAATALFIFRVSQSGTVTQIAGDGNFGSGGDGGPAVKAEFNGIYGIAVDNSSRTLYLVDGGNFRLRAISSAGIITTVAGTGVQGFSGDGGQAKLANMNPTGVAIDGARNLYLADAGRIRMIALTGVISTIGGNGLFTASQIGAENGDGGPALMALTSAGAVAVDSQGNVYFADLGSYSVRELLPTTSTVGCAYSVLPSQVTVTYTGGADNAIVTTARADCPWLAFSTTNWISLTSGAGGPGNGSVNFTESPNAGAAARTGIIAVAGQSVTVSQPGAPCILQLGADQISASAAGLTSTLSVGANLPSCSWTASSNAYWIFVRGGTSGQGNGTVTYSVAQNSGGSRTGTMTVAAQTVTVNQAGVTPQISLVGSSATGASPFSAGQLISIYGTQLGPTPGSGAQVNSNGVVTNSNGGTQVLFDGVAAPILYAGASQVNAAVPCSVAGRSSTQLIVQYLGALSAPYAVPLNPAAPGIFTLNGSGSGEGVVLNQDYSLNGPLNPAARGSAVAFYATGIGPTSPCVDGQTYQSNFPLATFSVIAGVGNLGAQVLYSGQAPYFMSGVDQINIVIPRGSPTGSVPLSLLVDGVFSPPGVTIAVK